MKPEPKQEPVAWMESPHGAVRVNPLYRFTAGTQTLKWALPLYLHPAPQQTPMTEEQIETTEWSDDIHTIIRAVERYHGIGDK